jgi:carbamate kinase
MGPKVAAVCEFAERTGHFAAIGSLTDAEAILKGEAGTFVAPSGYLAESEHDETVEPRQQPCDEHGLGITAEKQNH